MKLAALVASSMIFAAALSSCGSDIEKTESSPSTMVPTDTAPSSVEPSSPRTFASDKSIGPESVTVKKVEIHNGSLFISLRGPRFGAVHWRTSNGKKITCGDSMSGTGEIQSHVIQCAETRPPGVLFPSVDLGDFTYEFEVKIPVLKNE